MKNDFAKEFMEGFKEGPRMFFAPLRILVRAFKKEVNEFESSPASAAKIKAANPSRVFRKSLEAKADPAVRKPAHTISVIRNGKEVVRTSGTRSHSMGAERKLRNRAAAGERSSEKRVETVT